MGRSEQIEELDVLKCIFPDEIEEISETDYRISVYCDTKESDGSDARLLQFILHTHYPPDYPDEPPVLEILCPPNTAPNPLFNAAEDSAYLLSSITETIEENMGMAMIFTIVSTLQDITEQLISNRRQLWQQEQERSFVEAEREENKKFHGTPVTSETFAAWRDGFIREMEELQRQTEATEELAEKKKTKSKDAVLVLTGKQLWLNGMVGKLDDEEIFLAEGTT